MLGERSARSELETQIDFLEQQIMRISYHFG